jgi:hypothetical protein
MQGLPVGKYAPGGGGGSRLIIFKQDYGSGAALLCCEINIAMHCVYIHSSFGLTILNKNFFVISTVVY